MHSYKKHILFFIAHFGFSGKLKPAPGTWGTAAGALCSIAILIFFGKIGLLAFALVSFAIGIYAASYYSRESGIMDNSEIVIDEVASIALTFLFVPPPLGIFPPWLCAVPLF